MAEHGQDLAVFAERELLRKTVVDASTAMAVTLVGLGGVAYFALRFDLWPIALFLVAAGALLELWLVVNAIQTVAVLVGSEPVVYFGPSGLWLATVGWIDRDEIAELVVLHVGGRPAEIAIVPKDRTIVRRFTLVARISAAMSSWAAGAVAGIPWKGLSVAGPDLLAYIQTRYGLHATDKPLDPADLVSGFGGKER
jgi:hypothetical protein